MIRKVLPILLALLLIAAFWRLPALDQGTERVPPDTQPRGTMSGSMSGSALPPGHPPVDGDAMSGDGSGAVFTGDITDLPLKPDGLSSAVELEHALAKIEDEQMRKVFNEAFHLTFTTDRQSRDYELAKTKFQQVLQKYPDLAECYRGLAYAEFNTTLSFPKTIALYEKAIELDDDYGEAHYALAFMLGNSDPEQGRIHFERAIALGIKDERGLKERFFPGEN